MMDQRKVVNKMTEDKALALQLAANLVSTHMTTANKSYKTIVDISIEVQSLADRLLEWLTK